MGDQSRSNSFSIAKTWERRELDALATFKAPKILEALSLFAAYRLDLSNSQIYDNVSRTEPLEMPERLKYQRIVCNFSSFPFLKPSQQDTFLTTLVSIR